jgi:hypothetical protein
MMQAFDAVLAGLILLLLVELLVIRERITLGRVPA